MIKNFKIYEKKVDVVGLIEMIETLQNMSNMIKILEDADPEIVESTILEFLDRNENNLDELTKSKIQYIAEVWNDALEWSDMLQRLKRRIDPLIKSLKKMK